MKLKTITVNARKIKKPISAQIEMHMRYSKYGSVVVGIDMCCSK